mmetsp:Transcript_29466/g.38036  ORF Transcript_29466/g.38036 Transcript_29466/m.38036 type:complete len:127 (-) Transcript_29466:232-612(-)
MRYRCVNISVMRAKAASSIGWLQLNGGTGLDGAILNSSARLQRSRCLERLCFRVCWRVQGVRSCGSILNQIAVGRQLVSPTGPNEIACAVMVFELLELLLISFSVISTMRRFASPRIVVSNLKCFT